MQWDEYTEIECELISAVELGDLNKATKLIENGGNVNTVNRFNQNLLFLACFHGHKELAYFLLSKGADILNSKVRPRDYQRRAASSYLSEQDFFSLIYQIACSNQKILYQEEWINRCDPRDRRKAISKLSEMVAGGQDNGLAEELFRTVQLKGFDSISAFLSSSSQNIYAEQKVDVFSAACCGGNIEIIESLLDSMSMSDFKISNSYKFWFYPDHLHVFKLFLEKGFVREGDFKSMPLYIFSSKEDAKNLFKIVESHYHLTEEKTLELLIENKSTNEIFSFLFENMDTSKLSLKIIESFYSYFKKNKMQEMCENIEKSHPDLNKQGKNITKAQKGKTKWKTLEKSLLRMIATSIRCYAKKNQNVLCSTFCISLRPDHGYIDLIPIDFSSIKKKVPFSKSYYLDILQGYHSIGEFKEKAKESDEKIRILEFLEQQRRDSADFKPIEEFEEKWDIFQDDLIDDCMSDEDSTCHRLFELCCKVAMQLKEQEVFKCLKLDPDFEIIVEDQNRGFCYSSRNDAVDL